MALPSPLLLPSRKNEIKPALIRPEQHHKHTTPPRPLHPPVPMSPVPQGRHHPGFPMHNSQPGRAPGVLHPAASNQQELQLVGNVNVLENKLQVGFSRKPLHTIAITFLNDNFLSRLSKVLCKDFILLEEIHPPDFPRLIEKQRKVLILMR